MFEFDDILNLLECTYIIKDKLPTYEAQFLGLHVDGKPCRFHQKIWYQKQQCGTSLNTFKGQEMETGAFLNAIGVSEFLQVLDGHM